MKIVVSAKKENIIEERRRLINGVKMAAIGKYIEENIGGKAEENGNRVKRNHRSRNSGMAATAAVLQPRRCREKRHWKRQRLVMTAERQSGGNMRRKHRSSPGVDFGVDGSMACAPATPYIMSAVTGGAAIVWRKQALSWRRRGAKAHEEKAGQSGRHPEAQAYRPLRRGIININFQ